MNQLGWVYLIIAGFVEIIYASVMPKTEGFTRLVPSVVCILFIAISMYLLSLATKPAPLGTAYAVWVGIGTVGTAVYGITALGEDKSILKVVFYIMIVAGVSVLKLLTPGATNLIVKNRKIQNSMARNLTLSKCKLN